MPLTIVRNDITRLDVDAIVNAANTALQMGGGVCGAIFHTAGADKLQAACDRLAPIQTGEAVITEGFNLHAKYIIHAAGPVYCDGKHGEDKLLSSCYKNALELAVQHGCESIAFPLISSGIYGYPKADALSIATQAIRGFISEHDIDVSLVVFDKEAFKISEGLLGAIESYIDEHYVEESVYKRHLLRDARRRSLPDTDEMSADMPIYESAYGLDMPPGMPTAAPTSTRAEIVHTAFMPGMGAAFAAKARAVPAAASIDELVGNLDESFSATLLRLIDTTGRKDVEVYRRANIDRRLFSKIRSNENYVPTKATVLAFAIALELTLDQTADLLARAGFALSPSRKFDVIVEYFIQSRNYDIFEINNVLFAYDQPLLGG